MSDLLREIGSRIKTKREGLKLSQETLAERAGSTQKTISSIENGKQDMGALTLGGIAPALDMTVSEIMGEVPSSTRESLLGELVIAASTLDKDELLEVRNLAQDFVARRIRKASNLQQKQAKLK